MNDAKGFARFLPIFVIIAFVLFQSQEFDWTQLGVNVTLVGFIIGLVQFLKATAFKNAPGWIFMAISIAISATVGYFSAPEGAAIEEVIRLAFGYATASAWIYNLAKRTPGLDKVFQDGKALAGKRQ